jgi:ribonuclease HI
MRQLVKKYSDPTVLSCYTEFALIFPPHFKQPVSNLITSTRAEKVLMWTDGSHYPETTTMSSAANFVNSENLYEALDAVKCKPSPNNALVLKAELIAIIFGQLHIRRDVQVEICTHSERVIKGIKRYSLGMQQRSILKEDHHDLFS